MKKYQVSWTEERLIDCYAEVEAGSPDEAIRIAQSGTVEVDEVEDYTRAVLPGAKVREIE